MEGAKEVVAAREEPTDPMAVVAREEMRRVAKARLPKLGRPAAKPWSALEAAAAGPEEEAEVRPRPAEALWWWWEEERCAWA